ncbi:hypothetical protein [Bacteroides xylanisolvens]|uniref:hypothetical protein n=1 Tax=Bacteroides xylanisolvens TaxID=371601 RepID=UPI00129CF10F
MKPYFFPTLASLSATSHGPSTQWYRNLPQVPSDKTGILPILYTILVYFFAQTRLLAAANQTAYNAVSTQKNDKYNKQHKR